MQRVMSQNVIQILKHKLTQSFITVRIMKLVSVKHTLLKVGSQVIEVRQNYAPHEENGKNSETEGQKAGQQKRWILTN